MKPYYNYDYPWRPTYEATAAWAWSFAFAVLVYQYLFTSIPKYHTMFMAITIVIFASHRWYKTITNWEEKIRLADRPVMFMHPRMLIKNIRKSITDLWLGYGFDWKPRHTQKAYDLNTRNVQIAEVPRWYKFLRGVKPLHKDYRKGNPYLHGVEKDEEELRIPLLHLDQHTLVLGTTGSGKSSLLQLMITAAILRGEAVIVIDPKSDKGLKAAAIKACKLAGRPDAMYFFHPAFPQQSCRLDPLQNWNRPTEIASRISSLIPSETGNDPFTAFAWRVLQILASALVMVGERPNIVRLKRLVEGGPDTLLVRVLTRHFALHNTEWREDFKEYMVKARNNTFQKPHKGSPIDVVAMVQLYKDKFERAYPNNTVSGLLSLFFHDREHLSRLIASLFPVLDMLTAGDLEALLSPNPADHDDERPILDSKRIIEEKLVCLVGLDSLSDGVIGSSIGSILLADMTAVAGEKYNYEDKHTRVNIFIDEANEVLNQPCIQMLNKSRGCGYAITLCSQSIPDFIVRTDNESKARQVLANVNNLIAFRSKEGVTQEYIVESFGKTIVKTLVHQTSTGSVGKDISTFSSSYGERQQEVEADLFSADLLGQLPDLQYIGHVSGGRIIKGRLPLIEWEKG